VSLALAVVSRRRPIATAPADVLIFDPGAPRKIDPSDFHSHTKNSPFVGRLMQGRVSRTIVAGKTVFES